MRGGQDFAELADLGIDLDAPLAVPVEQPVDGVRVLLQCTGELVGEQVRRHPGDTTGPKLLQTCVVVGAVLALKAEQCFLVRGVLRQGRRIQGLPRWQRQALLQRIEEEVVTPTVPPQGNSWNEYPEEDSRL